VVVVVITPIIPKRAIEVYPAPTRPIPNIPLDRIIPMARIPTRCRRRTEGVAVAVGIIVMLLLGIITVRGGAVMGGGTGEDRMQVPVRRVGRLLGVGGIRVRRAWRVLVVLVCLLPVLSAGPPPPGEEDSNPLPPASSAT